MVTEKQLTIKDVKVRTEGKEMDLSLMGISKVPVKEIAAISKATTVDLSCNCITVLPEEFCPMLRHLVKLDLSKNQLVDLPKDLGRMENLQHLDLYKNQIKTLPVSFSNLRALKWLDLKDNPLEGFYMKIVGDCLDDKQCKQCAQNVVAQMKIVSSNQERERQKHLRDAREKAAAKKVEEHRLAELRKQEKKKEREQRRLEWEKQQKELQETKEKSFEEENNVSETESPDASSQKSFSINKGFWGYGFVFFLLTVFIAIGAGLYFYCQEHPSDQYCVYSRAQIQTLKRSGQTYSTIAIEYIKQAIDLILDNAKAGKAFFEAKISQIVDG